MALCKCDCGVKKTVRLSHLNNGNTKSCGCLQREINKERLLAHGKTGTQIYSIWANMLQKCKNAENITYSTFWNRGIAVCEEWKTFNNFYKDMGDPPAGRNSLDRINNDIGYQKDNCRWTTRKLQSRNSRGARMIELDGQRLCIMEWSERTGLPAATILGRLNLGWSIRDALFKPKRKHQWKKRE